MKKLIATAIFSCTLFAGLSETNVTKKVRTPEERKARREQRMMARYGGMVCDFRNQEGFIAVVNMQEAVGNDIIASASKKFEDVACIPVKTNHANAVTIGEADAFRSSQKANLVVFVVNDPALPGLITAIENRWAMVNVARYTGPNQAEWTNIELQRAMYFLCGAGVTPDRAAVTAPVTKPSQLSFVDVNRVSFENNMAISANLKFLGIRPFVRRLYSDACTEGWAPQPTNEYQKEIWDKVHAIPKTPMKIEFDPKKGR